MAINYEKVGWDTTKYFNPTNMNHMDDGIKAACDKADANEEAIADVNSNLGLINKKTFLWETSSNQGSKEIDFSPFNYVLIMLTNSGYTTQSMLSPNYVQSLSALGIQTQVGLYSQNEYVYANITYDGTTFSFSSNKNVLLDVIGIQ